MNKMFLMAASMVEGGEDSFRKIFKFYRRRNPPPDLSDVIDFSRCAPGEQVRAKRAPGVYDVEATRVGLQPVREWRAFGLRGHPGTRARQSLNKVWRGGAMRAVWFNSVRL
uniref:AlkB homolog 1, histone H2A dioxygenase n=1 Tax=Maylandia zebra TaxID=106582 RepID=A0A3P9BA12_9CICH